jgi:methylated-DNA-protein-cysteine methyltransferase-like protein
MAASDSYKKIWEQAALIPAGQVASYGQVAKQAGLPRRGARMVARAVAAAPREMELPWHRIVNAQGCISIPKTSARYEQQQELLRAEGVPVKDGKLDIDKHGWSPTLDELLWGPGMFNEPDSESESGRQAKASGDTK